jgi:hypothetical protein
MLFSSRQGVGPKLIAALPESQPEEDAFMHTDRRLITMTCAPALGSHPLPFSVDEA